MSQTDAKLAKLYKAMLKWLNFDDFQQLLIIIWPLDHYQQKWKRKCTKIENFDFKIY